MSTMEKIDYVELRIGKYEDGEFEAYEALSDTRTTSKSWQEIREWVNQMLDDTEKACPELLEGSAQ